MNSLDRLPVLFFHSVAFMETVAFEQRTTIKSWSETIEFFLYVFTEFAKFSEKKYCILKRIFEPAICCSFRGQDATTVPARHRKQIGSLNLAQFILQWFIKCPEVNEFHFCSIYEKLQWHYSMIIFENDHTFNGFFHWGQSYGKKI